MASLPGLTTTLTLDGKAFLRDINRATRATEKATFQMRKSMRQVERSAQGVQRAFGQLRAGAAALAGALAVRQFAQFTRAAIDSSGAIQDVADKVGLSTKSLQELRFAASQTGVNIKTVDMAMQRFSRRIAEVAAGQGELLKVAQQYNIVLRTGDGRMRSNIEILKDFADVMRDAESDQERLRIAFKLFDSEGAALVNTLRDGRVALEDYMEQASAFGAVMSNEVIARAKIAGDNLAVLEQVYRTSFNTSVIQSFAGALTLTEENLRAAQETGRQFGRLVGAAMKGVVSAAKFVAENMREITAVLGGLIALKATNYFIALAGAVLRFAAAVRAAAISGGLFAAIGTGAKKGAAGLLAAAGVFAAIMTAADSAGASIDKAQKELEQFLDTGAASGGVGVAGDIDKSLTNYRRQAEDLQNLISALKVSRAEYMGVKENLELLNEAERLGLQATDDRAIAWITAARNAREYKRELDGLMEIQRAQDEVQIARMEAGAAGIFGQKARRQAELAIDRQRKINELIREYGTVAEGTGAKLLALWDQQTKLQEQARIKTEQVTNAMETMQNFADRAFDRIGNAITDAFVRGEDAAVSFKSVMRGVISEITQMFVKLAVLNPIQNTLFGGNASTLSSLVSGFGSLFGPTAGGGSSGGIPLPMLFHKGGVVGHDPAPTRVVNPAVFNNAPRFHDGLKSDEFPAILQKGETVIPKGGKEGQTINIYPDLRGASAESVAALHKMVLNLQANVPSMAVAAATEHVRRNKKLY